MQTLDGWIEAVIFATDHPLSSKEIEFLLQSVGLETTHQEVKNILRRLQSHYNTNQRGIELVKIAGGWQFRTKNQYSELLLKLFAQKPPKLSKAALETLAAVAYHQPITRSEIDVIRGVDSGGVLRGLLNRKLVEVVGRKEDAGRPYIYGTSPGFLEFFALNDIAELPELPQHLKEPKKSDEDEAIAPTPIEAAIAQTQPSISS